jgi:hypothetical protein
VTHPVVSSRLPRGLRIALLAVPVLALPLCTRVEARPKRKAMVSNEGIQGKGYRFSAFVTSEALAPVRVQAAFWVGDKENNRQEATHPYLRIGIQDERFVLVHSPEGRRIESGVPGRPKPRWFVVGAADDLVNLRPSPGTEISYWLDKPGYIRRTFENNFLPAGSQTEKRVEIEKGEGVEWPVFEGRMLAFPDVLGRLTERIRSENKVPHPGNLWVYFTYARTHLRKFSEESVRVQYKMEDSKNYYSIVGDPTATIRAEFLRPWRALGASLTGIARAYFLRFHRDFTAALRDQAEKYRQDAKQFDMDYYPGRTDMHLAQAAACHTLLEEMAGIEQALAATD